MIEEYGGDVVAVPVSATTGAGLDDLLESIELVAEISELTANPDRRAVGVIVEAELDPRRGPLASVLIKSGTLRQGDALVTGLISGKVKAMFNDLGERVTEALPAQPVQIMGLEEVPEAGDRVIRRGGREDGTADGRDRAPRRRCGLRRTAGAAASPSTRCSTR